MTVTAVNVQVGETEYELEVDYSWEDHRMGLLRWDLTTVTVLNGPKPEHDVDPELFLESLNDADIADIESQIKDKSE